MHHERIIEIEAPRVIFGRGAVAELGAHASALDVRRVALIVDPGLAGGPFVAAARASLKAAGIDVAEFSGVRIEPTDASFQEAAAFAADAHPDAYVSIGGGSTIDTAKAANLYATYPAPFAAYVNAPLGDARPVPGPLKPHIAVPTTSGTGSECTGVAIFDDVARDVKTGIASRRLRPTLGIVDPDATRTLPAGVVAASGFDVLAHALESYTARPYTAREAPASPATRPLSQGANMYSDLGCREALRLMGMYLERAVADASDDEAREATMWASTLAGIAFGNAGVHVPHGMAYAVAGLAHDFYPEDYPHDHAMVPHGMSVIVSAPSVARFTAPAAPGRHRVAAAQLGVTGRFGDDEVGDALAGAVIRLMRATGMPSGLRALGFTEEDLPRLIDGAAAQQRLLANAPLPIERAELGLLFAEAYEYW